MAQGLKADVLIVGEGVTVDGTVETVQDLRADVWCRFKKNVTVSGDACIGEFTTVDGKIFVQGDMDIGKEVKLNGGFETHGWVVVRNPLPIMIYLFMYIRALIGVGKTSEEIDRALEELFDDDEIYPEDIAEIDLMTLPGFENMFLLPLGSKISETAASVPDEAKIGSDCRIVCDIYASKIFVGTKTEITGLVRSKGDVCLSENTSVFGDIQAGGRIIIGKDGYVSGDVRAKTVYLHESAAIDGKIMASDGVSMMTDEKIAEMTSHFGDVKEKTGSVSEKAKSVTEKAKSVSERAKTAAGKSKRSEKTDTEKKKADDEPIFREIEITRKTAGKIGLRTKKAAARRRRRRKNNRLYRPEKRFF